MDSNNRKKRFYDDEIFQQIGGLLRILREDEDAGDDVRGLLDTLVPKLKSKKGEYFYPWYCLLTALAADLLHYRQKEGWFIRWDQKPSFLADAYGAANRAWDAFWLEKPLSPLSEQVMAFLGEAKSVFIADCWHVIDPKEYDRADAEKLRALLNAIPEDDVRYSDCESVFHELHSLLAAGLDDLIAPLSMISAIELGDADDA